MEIAFFVPAFLLLAVLIYGSLNWHFRNRTRDRATDEVIRDRYEHNRT